MITRSRSYSIPTRMTVAETRTPPTEQGYTEEEMAAVVAALLAGHFMAAALAGSPVNAIARLIRPLIDLPGTLAVSVADSVARLAVTSLPKRPAASQSSDFASLAYVDNLVFRGHYVVAAARRLEASVAAEEDAPLGGRLEAAMTREAQQFESHQDAMRRKVASVKMVEAAAERWGPVLGWRHGNHTERTCAHNGAGGQNFDTRRGVPASTGGLPGASPGCTCAAVAPFDNARLLS